VGEVIVKTSGLVELRTLKGGKTTAGSIASLGMTSKRAKYVKTRDERSGVYRYAGEI
jgi:hypothetical protein